MEKPIPVSKILMFALYFVILLVVTGELFFEEQFNSMLGRLFPQRIASADILTIGLSEAAVSNDPLANDTGTRNRLLHVFEPLVSVNADLQIEPALAISYGSLDDLTWELRLRPGVLFHGGTPLDFEKVLASLEAAQSQNSGVRDLASTIKEVTKVDESIFRITTNSIDPLLLQKLSSILIFSQKADGSFDGTGPYELVKNEGGALTLSRFEKYWGTLPTFKTVILKTVLQKTEKVGMLRDSQVDILANLPADIATMFDYRNFELKARQSLEANFLMFNFDGVFGSRQLREAAKLALNTDQLSRLAQGFSSPTDQFVGNGIFGFNPKIPKKEFDVNRALALFAESGLQAPVKVVLDLPKGLETFGNGIKDQLKKIGLEIEPQYLTPAELGQKIINRKSDFYFFGWKNDLGDASDFLTSVAHSAGGSFGQFNGGNYKNPQVDELIESSQKTVKQDERLTSLREVMRKITADDIIGVPLFSPEVLYGVSNKLKWMPRVDGYVLAQEVKL
ncbi:MAG: ABC transporter substrate-binding protein [Patescibacteria group bacterium]